MVLYGTEKIRCIRFWIHTRCLSALSFKMHSTGQQLIIQRVGGFQNRDGKTLSTNAYNKKNEMKNKKIPRIFCQTPKPFNFIDEVETLHTFLKDIISIFSKTQIFVSTCMKIYEPISTFNGLPIYPHVISCLAVLMTLVLPMLL